MSFSIKYFLKPVVLDEHDLKRVSLICAFLLFIYEVYAVRVDYSEYLAYVVDSENAFFSAVTFICILVSFYAFYRLTLFALSASWPYRTLCFVIFALSLFIEYAYQKALGRFSDDSDIETAVATTIDQQVASLSMYISFKALIPCIALLLLFLFIRSRTKQGFKQFAVVNLLFVVSFVIFPTLIDQPFPTFATAALYRTSTDFLISGPISGRIRASSMGALATDRRPVAKPALPVGYRPDNNIVVIVDESVMGDHLSLNGYERRTTPVLDDLASRHILHNWGIAASASSASRFTYYALVTGLTPDNFPDANEFKVKTFPTIFQYAKAMNYTTYFFDGQMVAYWGANNEDTNYIDNWLGVHEISDNRSFEPYDLDNQIADKVKSIIYGSKGNFIFIFKHGSHIPYQNNFPPDQEAWRPSYATTDKFEIPSADQLQSVKNAYDNSILYNVNSFFTNLIDDYSRIPNNSLLLYTGDHGQTLFVNGKASHGGKTKGEATVPLFIIGKLDDKIDTGYKASHANIFPTLLDLMSYPRELRDTGGLPSLLTARTVDSRPRFFNPGLTEKVPFD